MTKLDQIRLAIYEKCEAGEITDAEKKTLLESAVEKYSEKEPLTDIEEAAVDSIVEGILTFTEAMEVINSDEEEEVEEGALEDLKKLGKKTSVEKVVGDVDKAVKENKMFVESFNKLKESYNKAVDDAKDNIKQKKVAAAMINIKQAEVTLERMKMLIQHTPTTLDNAAMSHISDDIKYIIAHSIVAITFSVILKCIADYNIDPEELKSEMKKYQVLHAAVNGVKSISTKEPNLFKADAILAINKEIVRIKKLEKKLEKVKAKMKEDK